MRWFGVSIGLFIVFFFRRHRSVSCGRYWQFESKRSALPNTFAVDAQGAVHFFGRQRRAMQTESTTVFLGCKAVAKNARQIFWGDTNAIIAHCDGNISAGCAADRNFE